MWLESVAFFIALMQNTCLYENILNHNYWKVKEKMTMCDICLQSPCHPRCPNAPDPPAVYICSGCGHTIREGDDYWEVLGEQFCGDCIFEYRKEAVYDPY